MNQQSTLGMVCYCEKCTAFGKKGPCNFDKYRENMEKRQPTLLEINERIPISKQDYLHLLYRVEELERVVARLKAEKEELPTDEQIMEAWGKVPKEVKQAFGYVEEDPFEQAATTYGCIQTPGVIKTKKSLQEMLDEVPDGMVWDEAMCEYQPNVTEDENYLTLRGPMTREQVKEVIEGYVRKCDKEDPFIEKFNKQQ